MLEREQIQMLRKPNFAHLATVAPDGSPQVTPVWVDVREDEDLILVNTAEGRRKVKNIRQNPQVAIDVIEQENPYNMVSIKGEVVDITAEGADEHIDSLAKKYLGKDKYPFRQPGEKRLILKIRPERVAKAA
ncbi:MAG TPA: PPOX class F420-dependent oxidoreductase [Actinomycetota bacterium]|jgi:PPOX class probable F420-dependent enzyme|nr:PPOX class F420-dependent oxidoreductase [Actinomycetota bacterium]